jgi:hypothetical protein
MSDLLSWHVKKTITSIVLAEIHTLAGFGLWVEMVYPEAKQLGLKPFFYS